MLFPKPPKRQKRRGHRDPVRPEDHEAVVRRDGGCVAAILDREHTVCQTTWGQVHEWNDVRYLTVDHVQEGYGMTGRRAPSRVDRMVAMCGEGNRLWGPTHREEEREWLRRWYPGA